MWIEKKMEIFENENGKWKKRLDCTKPMFSHQTISYSSRIALILL